MQQPKNDDRYKVEDPRITKAQHIIPAKIIKEWKQDRILLTKIKNNPKLQKISNERNDLFCVYHRWTQNVENWKTTIEKDFYKLCDELDKNNTVVCLQIEKHKEKETILDYFYCLMACNYLINNNSFVTLNIDEDIRKQRPAYTRAQVDAFEYESCGMFVEESNGKICCDTSLLTFQRSFIIGRSRLKGNKETWTNTWFYIKTKERLYLPDRYQPIGSNQETCGIINVSPNSAFISLYFIHTQLNILAYMNKVSIFRIDIMNPPTIISKCIKISNILNQIALVSYNKWLIL